jgi:hypothetical protein
MGIEETKREEDPYLQGIIGRYGLAIWFWSPLDLAFLDW